MHIENQRLIAGVQESVDGMAALSDTPQAKALQAAATTMLCELLRREDPRQLGGNYAQGRACGMHILAAMAAAGKSSAAGAARLAELPAAMDAAVNIEAGYVLLESLRAVLTQLIAESGYPVGKIGGGDAAIDAAVLAVFNWEAAVCKLPPPRQAPRRSVLDIRSVLEQSTRNRGGVFSNARVTKCQPLPGGFGKNTTLFEVEDDERQTWRLVSRAMQDIDLLGLPGQDIGKEFHLLRYAFRHGIRVAEPLWLENDVQTHGVRFLVSRQAAGRNFGTAVSSEPLTAAQVKSLARELAAIHRLPLDPADPDLQRSPLDLASGNRSLEAIVDEYLKFWIDMWRSKNAGPYPVVEVVFKWLRANMPRTDDVPVLLHGDYALHNILIEGDEVSAALDWEVSHVGDRAEEISWLLSSIGKHVTQDEFMTQYLAAGGRPVSQFRIKYYEVLVHLKMLIVATEAQIRFQQLAHAGAHFSVLGLNFIQHPSSSLEGAIRAAEAARQ